MMKDEQTMAVTTFSRKSTSKTPKLVIPFNVRRSTSTPTHNTFEESSAKSLLPPPSPSPLRWLTKSRSCRNRRVSTLVSSLLNIISFSTTFKEFKKLVTSPLTLSITPSPGRKVFGTLFGARKGHVSFALQNDIRDKPVLILELDISTSALVEEMSTGTGRIVLECEKSSLPASGRPGKLYSEPKWSMYCRGRKCGYARSRTCMEADWNVMSTIRSVSVGAGVIPAVEGGGGKGELVYMRGKFERVVGSRDSEAFHMTNPDGDGGPELSIFLLRK